MTKSANAQACPLQECRGRPRCAQCVMLDEMYPPQRNLSGRGEDGPDDAEIGRQWRENSSLEKWFPLTAERLAKLEQWARDCRDQVLYPAAQREDAIGKAADGLGQSLAKFHLGPNASLSRP